MPQLLNRWSVFDSEKTEVDSRQTLLFLQPQIGAAAAHSLVFDHYNRTNDGIAFVSVRVPLLATSF